MAGLLVIRLHGTVAAPFRNSKPIPSDSFRCRRA